MDLLTPVSRVKTLSTKGSRCIHKVTAREESVWSGEVSADTIILGEGGEELPSNPEKFVPQNGETRDG